MIPAGYLHSEHVIDNNGVAIHYTDITPDVPAHAPPIVLVPGMTTSAEMIAEALTTPFPRRCLVISVRGRGKSGIPPAGYTFHHQVSDVAAVVNSLDLPSVALYGHSVGAVFALGFALGAPHSVSALVLGDYPPVYPQFGAAWMERVLSYPTGMQEAAVRGIVREADRVSLASQLGRIACPVLVIRGGAEDSLLSAEASDMYMQHIPDCRVVVLPESGHDLLRPDSAAFVHSIENFLVPPLS